MFYKDNAFKRHCVGTELKFAWFPKRCYISNRKIWLECGYVQTAAWSGPGDVIFEQRWYHKNEFLVAKIKENV